LPATQTMRAYSPRRLTAPYVDAAAQAPGLRPTGCDRYDRRPSGTARVACVGVAVVPASPTPGRDRHALVLGANESGAPSPCVDSRWCGSGRGEPRPLPHRVTSHGPRGEREREPQCARARARVSNRGRGRRFGPMLRPGRRETPPRAPGSRCRCCGRDEQLPWARWRPVRRCRSYSSSPWLGRA